MLAVLEDKGAELHEMYSNTRTGSFGQEVKRRIILGTFALSSGYYDAYYLKAAQTRRLICREFEKTFKNVDFILIATTSEPVFLIGEKEDPIAMYLSDVFMVTAKFAGTPALSLPLGLRRQKLPISPQILESFYTIHVMEKSSKPWMALRIICLQI